MRSRSLLLPTLLATSLWSCQSADNPTVAQADWTFSVAPATTPFASPNQDIDLDAEAEKLQRKRAQQKYLAEQYIARGDEAFAVADLDGALVEYSNALSVMPSNQDVRDRMAKVEAAMGNRYALASEALDDEANRLAVKAAQAMIAAEDSARKGDQALRRGEYDDAIAQYKQADLILGYHPLVAEGNLTGEVIKAKLDQAEALREEAIAQAAADRAARAAEQEAEAAAAERDRKRELVYGLYAEAHMAFNTENYESAAELCEQVLAHDPGNPHAIDLRGLAVAAGNKKSTEDNLKRLREEWRRMMDDLNSIAVPQMDAIVFEDVEYWKGVNPREMIPGTTRAPDRFVRASTYIDMVVQSAEPRVAAAAAFSVIRNASVPYGITTPDAPNLSTTRWRVVADQKDRLFYVESAISPNVFWVDMTRLDFSEQAGVRWLDLGVDMANIHSGEVSDQFTGATPFQFEPWE